MVKVYHYPFQENAIDALIARLIKIKKFNMSNAELPSLKQVAEDNLKTHRSFLELAQSLIEIRVRHLKSSDNPQTTQHDAKDLNQLSLVAKRAARECDRYSKILKQLEE